MIDLVEYPTTHWQDKPTRGARVRVGHPLARGLRAFFAMTEGTGTQTYDALSRQIGTLTGAGVSWMASQMGLATRYAPGNSTGYVAGPASNALYLAGDRYGTLWAAAIPTTTATADAFLCILGSATNTGRFAISMDTAFAVHFQHTEFGFSEQTGGSVTTNVPHTIAGLCNGDAPSATVYADGLSVGSVSGVVSVLNTLQSMGTTTLKLGTRLNAGGNFFQGWLCAVGLWSRLLTAAEIGWLHAEPYTLLQRPRVYFVTPTAAFDATVAVAPAAQLAATGMTGRVYV